MACVDAASSIDSIIRFNFDLAVIFYVESYVEPVRGLSPLFVFALARKSGRNVIEGTNEFFELGGMGEDVIEGFQRKVAGGGIECSVNKRAFDDTFRVISENLEGHKMTTILSESNKLSAVFLTSTGPLNIVNRIIDRLPEAKAKEHASVHRLTGSLLKWNAANLLVPSAIKKKAHIQEGK